MLGTEIIDILTPRQTEILNLISRGYVYKEIADKLGIGIQTIKNHTTSIYFRLHASNAPHAVAIAKERGII